MRQRESRRHFSGTFHGDKNSRKSNNHVKALGTKTEIRLNVLHAIGADRANVFDAFAGEGEMFRRVWCSAASYVGCDKTWYRDHREMFVADNRRVMRAIDLGRFNVFDIDAWGSPWEQVAILCARRPMQPGERIGLVLTEGSSTSIKMSALPAALSALAHFNSGMPGLARAHGEIIDRALTEMCRRMKGRIVRRWQARGKTVALVQYIGLVLEGIDGADDAGA